MRHLRHVATLAALSILACTQESAQVPADVTVEMWPDELPIRQPWLREHLPDDSLAYLRIPHIFGLLATPKGNVLDPALRSKTNVENLQKIRQGIVDNVLTMIPPLSDPRIRMFEKHVRSPIEVSAKFLPAPSALIAVNLDLDSNEALSDLIGEIGYSLTAPLDAQGKGQVDAIGMPLFMQFDAASGRLLVNVGPGVTAEQFNTEIEALDRDTPHRMRSLENRVDESGQGMFFWIDAQTAMPAIQMTMQPDQLQELLDLGFDKIAALGLGWGVADGKGRLSLVVDMPADGDRGFLPNVSNDLSARSVGNPDGFFVLSIPSSDEFSRLETLAMETAGAEASAEWLEGKELINEFTGVTIEEVLAALGPELLIILDQAGDYGAIRLRDADLWDSVIGRIANASDSRPDERQVAGETYYHWSMPNEIAMMDGEAATAELGWFADLLARQRDHVYWVQDGDYLYFASAPQTLFDRATMRAQTDIGTWLTETQHIDVSHALVSMSSTSRKIPRRLYAFYIELSQILADIAQTDIDVWSMPTATQLGLPELGTLGFTVSLGNPTLAAELTFESNPGEMLGGMGTVAMVGIVAAIAIPAYQDYTVRARISVGLNMAAPAKAAVTEYYMDNGRFPGPADAERLSIPETGDEYVRSVMVDPVDGMVVIEYVDTVVPGGGQLWLQPSVSDNGPLIWNCRGTFEDKHLPAACR